MRDDAPYSDGLGVWSNIRWCPVAETLYVEGLSVRWIALDIR